MSVEKIRNEIDLIDSEIIRILKRRMELCLRIGKLKKLGKMKINDREREEEIKKRIIENSCGVITPDFSKRFFSFILKESRKIRREKFKIIGFQGEHGSYSEISATVFDPEFKTIPFKNFNDIFDAIEEGSIDFGIVPVENSVAGVVKEVLELLAERDVFIVGSVSLKIRHSLLSIPENTLKDIKIVFSHEMALSQCKKFLERHEIESKPFYDTAGSAIMISRERIKGVGAIASSRCAKLYNLKIIKEGIQDFENNYTKFLIISKRKGLNEGKKCSILFSLSDGEEALTDLFKMFNEKLKITKFIIIPFPVEKIRYIAFTEFLCSQIEPVLKLKNRLKEKTEIFKFFGFYNELKTESG
ncbi:MAG: bifunctional chorismate mutase/prephenate dehydratase [Candidatus Aminicenantia bacterium]